MGRSLCWDSMDDTLLSRSQPTRYSLWPDRRDSVATYLPSTTHSVLQANRRPTNGLSSSQVTRYKGVRQRDRGRKRLRPIISLPSTRSINRMRTVFSNFDRRHKVRRERGLQHSLLQEQRQKVGRAILDGWTIPPISIYFRRALYRELLRSPSGAFGFSQAGVPTIQRFSDSHSCRAISSSNPPSTCDLRISRRFSITRIRS